MKNLSRNYVVASTKSWNHKFFEERTPSLAGSWHLITDRRVLTLERLQALKPRYVFFPHWSWIVPDEILNRFDCVCFHMTDVPYGRGGSPLQNLIVRGHKTTQLTALRMVKQLDAGPVYLKRSLSLHGSAEAIYRRAGALSWEMIEEIIAENPQPTPQQGEVVEFQRRLPGQSLLKDGKSIEQVYDHIRMLDASGYPKAFVETAEYRIELTKADLTGDCVEAACKIFLKRKEA